MITDIFNITSQEAKEGIGGIFDDLEPKKRSGKQLHGTPDPVASQKLQMQGAVPASAKSTFKDPPKNLPQAFSSKTNDPEKRNQPKKQAERVPVPETKKTVPLGLTLGHTKAIRQPAMKQPAASSPVPKAQPSKQPERETMTTKPQSTGTETVTKTSDSSLRPVGELVHGMKPGDLLTGDEKSVEQTAPYPSITETQTNTGQGFLMDESIPIGGQAPTAASGQSTSGWLLSGKNPPKAFWKWNKTTPLADLLNASLLGFIMQSGPLDQVAENLWKERFVVDGFEKSAERFFEALSICRQSNRGNTSPEYLRAMSQLTQLGHAVLSTLKSYDLTAESHGFAVPQTSPAAAEQGTQTASSATASGNNPASTSGRSAYDGGNDWYFDEMAARRHAQQQQQNPQSWYLRTLNL